MEFGVDPNAVCEGKPVTPMEYARTWNIEEEERVEIFSLLAEFTEIPDPIKLFLLSKLMYKGENEAKEREEFKNLLSSLSVELVNNTSLRGSLGSLRGNLLQDAVVEGKRDFVRILLEFGADPHANTEEKEATPMEIAVEKDNFEVLIILAGFAEVSADMKVDFLRMILEDKGHKQISTPCEYLEEFKKNLEGVSIS